MNEIQTLVDRYVSLWNEVDPERRRELIAQTLTEDASYVGLVKRTDGHDGIARFAAELQEHLEGLQFHRIGEIDTHNDRIRFTWEVMKEGEESRFAAGTDFGIVTEDGRLQSITSFLDQAPAGTGAQEHGRPA